MRQQDTSFYMGSLDGLRFVSFVFVYCAHLPLEAASEFRLPIQTAFSAVDLFFVISAYLLWRLMDAEYHKRGGINIRDFYLRRVLRIYPLLVTFYTAMFVLAIIQTQSAPEPVAWFRYAANVFAFENVLAWLWDFNYTIPSTGQFWTLAFEVQVYLLLPWAFLAWKKHGTRALLVALLLIEVAALAGRCWWAIDSDAETRALRGIFVIPFVRPDAVLMGIVLAVIRPAWNATWSVAVAVMAAVATLMLPSIDEPYGATYTYIVSAIMVGALVDAGLRFGPLRGFLTLRPIRYLGMITYGLYVFHIAAIWTVVKILRRIGVDGALQGPAIIVLSLVLVFVVSAVSFKYLESPFLRLKRRFEAVHARGDSLDQPPSSHASASGVPRVDVP